MAIVHIKQSKNILNFPVNVLTRTGVYEPAINKNIELWSKILRTDLIFSLIAPWYNAEDKNINMKKIPYTT